MTGHLGWQMSSSRGSTSLTTMTSSVSDRLFMIRHVRWIGVSVQCVRPVQLGLSSHRLYFGVRVWMTLTGFGCAVHWSRKTPCELSGAGVLFS